MKSFIFTFVVMVSCILQSQGLSLESESTTTTRMSTTTLATTASETPSSAPVSVSTPTTMEALHPLVKAVTAPPTASASPTTTTATTTTKAPGAGQQQCKEIGSACSVSDECCSRRCFSYRRRCAY